MEPKLQKVVLWYIAKKQYISQTKQQNLLRCEVVTVQEAEIAPVLDGPGWEHHDNCEHNRSGAHVNGKSWTDVG